MVEPEIEWLRLSSGQNLKGFRRLLLSLTEVEIWQGHSYKTDSLARELLGIYRSLREPDIIDRLGHVRALIAFARVSPTLEDATRRWNDALDWNRFYNPLEDEVPTCGVIYLFLCITWHRLGNIGSSREAFRSAMGVLKKKRPQFLIPGIGTCLFRGACEEVQSTTGWRLEIWD